MDGHFVWIFNQLCDMSVVFAMEEKKKSRERKWNREMGSPYKAPSLEWRGDVRF